MPAKRRKSGFGGGIDAHTRTERETHPGDLSRSWGEIAPRVLSIDAKLNRVSAGLDRFLREREWLSTRDEELFAHQVDSGSFFGDGVLDLDAGVHFEKENAPLGSTMNSTVPAFW